MNFYCFSGSDLILEEWQWHTSIQVSKQQKQTSTTQLHRFTLNLHHLASKSSRKALNKNTFNHKKLTFAVVSVTQ